MVNDPYLKVLAIPQVGKHLEVAFEGAVTREGRSVNQCLQSAKHHMHVTHAYDRSAVAHKWRIPRATTWRTSHYAQEQRVAAVSLEQPAEMGPERSLPGCQCAKATPPRSVLAACGRKKPWQESAGDSAESKEAVLLVVEIAALGSFLDDGRRKFARSEEVGRDRRPAWRPLQT